MNTTDTTDDQKYMLRSIELAKKGIPYASPNPTVGAVIVHNNKIIGEGYHRIYGGPHAEVNAVNSVRNKEVLHESTIYVTLEPCSHYGKTPPCADMLIQNRIKRVVIGCVDPFSKVHGNGIKKLRDAGIDVTVGVCEKECKELIRKFTTFHSKKRPYIILKWAQSADGFIDKTRTEGHPVVISNKISQIYVHKKRSECSAIIVGTNTALLDNPSLTTRKWAGKNPVRVVIDKKLAIPEQSKLFDGSVQTIIFTNTEKEQTKENVKYIKTDNETDCIEFILKKLHEMEMQSLMVEGGAILLQSFIDKGLWDEAVIETGNIVIKNGVKAPILKDYILNKSKKCLGSIINQYTHNCF